MSKPPKPRPIFHLCVSGDNSYMVRRQKNTGPPPSKIFVPWLNQNDPRMFVRNGELIKPYGIVEFVFQRLEECPELSHDRAFYREVGRTDFDPTGCVPIAYFDIEKVADQLNEAQALIEKSVPMTDADEQSAA